MWAALLPILKAAGTAAATSAASTAGSKIAGSLLDSGTSTGFNPSYLQNTTANINNLVQKTPTSLQSYLPTTNKSIYDRIFEELYKSKIRNL